MVHKRTGPPQGMSPEPPPAGAGAEYETLISASYDWPGDSGMPEEMWDRFYEAEDLVSAIEPRTLEGFDLQAGCHIHLLPNNMHAPHLLAGEWAVVDPACREIEPGGLYLVMQSSGPIVWQVLAEPEHWRARRADREWPCWMLVPMNRPASAEDARRALMAGQRVYASGGPISADCLEVLGKVAGVFLPMVDSDVARPGIGFTPAVRG